MGTLIPTFPKGSIGISDPGDADPLLRLGVDEQLRPFSVSLRAQWSAPPDATGAHGLCGALQLASSALWPAGSESLQVHRLPGGCLSVRHIHLIPIRAKMVNGRARMK